MFKFIAITLLAFSTLATPTTRDELLDSIARISGKINDDIWRTSATTAQLEQANQKLLLAYKLIRKRAGNPSPRECVDYTFSILQRYYSDNSALTRAQNICRPVSDIKVFKYSFLKLERNYSEPNALERASKYAGRDMYGKYELLDFIYNKYVRMYSNSMALDRSYQMTRQHIPEAIICFRKYYDQFDARNSTSRALELTSNACMR